MRPTAHQRADRAFACRGFTLLELLVVIAIMAVLLSIVLVSLMKVRAVVRNVMCMNNFRNVAHDFFHFAHEYSHSSRGDSERYGSKAFRLEDFQEKLYQIDEFWDAEDSSEVILDRAVSALMCPAKEGALTKRKDLPCSQYAVTPVENVSTAFNMRLYQVSTVVEGWPRLQRTRLTSQILSQPEVPLVFDVDGARAAEQGVLPYYAGPPGGEADLYASGRFWFPSLRHGGKLNVAFIGGHVLSSPDPAQRRQRNWRYQPPLR